MKQVYKINKTVGMAFHDRTTGNNVSLDLELLVTKLKEEDKPKPIYFLLELNRDVDDECVSYFNSNGVPVFVRDIEEHQNWLVVKHIPPHVRYTIEQLNYVERISPVRIEVSL